MLKLCEGDHMIEFFFFFLDYGVRIIASDSSFSSMI